MDFSSGLSTFIVSGVFILLFVGIAVMFSRLYTRASKELTFVRTGLGGEKVIMDGGSLVFPVLHEVIKVNMNTLRLDVRRQAQNSLITKDKLRVDVQAEFYVRVGKSTESIAAAATTLGSKTTRPDELSRLIEGKFVDALRSVAASMAMSELHEQRKQFVAAVQEAVQVDLKKNGLELESVSLTGLDQTAREYFNENNAFDAEGLTKLTEEIETRRKARNQIEQDTRVEIERKRTEADKQAYAIAQENELAKIAQQKALDESRAKTEAEVAKTVAEQTRIAEEADIARTRAVQVAHIAKARDLALSEQDKKIKLAEKTEAEAAATAKANLAKAEAVKAEELVETARKTEIANREKAIAVIQAEQEAEQDAVAVRVTAEAEKQAAEDRSASIVMQARAEKERDELRAEGIKAVGMAEAEALERRNSAENSLSDSAANLRMRLALTKELSSIVSASVKPLEKIESIRIVDLDGFAPGGNGQGGCEGGAETADRVVNAALRHRAVAPLIDGVMAEVGLLGGLNGLATGKGNILSNLAPEPVSEPSVEATTISAVDSKNLPSKGQK